MVINTSKLGIIGVKEKPSTWEGLLNRTYSFLSVTIQPGSSESIPENPDSSPQ
jgi:hypothetical protein